MKNGQLRLRMKIYTAAAGDRWILALGFGKDFALPGSMELRDEVLGAGVLTCYALRDGEVSLITVTPEEWDALPWYYFVEEGPV